jgi:RAD50-interacting protein 1
VDAFETLSSAFVRAVPGALGASLTGKEEGVHVDTRKLMSGVEGVQRLCKAVLSAKYIEISMERWGEELVGCVHPLMLAIYLITTSFSLNCGRK